MQTFLPYSDFRKSFRVLDYRRLGKQRVEALTLIHVIEGVMGNGNKPKGWISHPITIMWKPFLDALKLYYNFSIEEWIFRGYKNTIPLFQIKEESVIFPDWLGYEPFHASHRSNLLRKDYKYYKQYGWKEDPSDPYMWRDERNKWYVYNRELKKKIYKL